MLSFIILLVGFACLVQGADYFVEGAAALARKLGISPLIVGLTVVALGTSAPELAVSITAGLENANEIAVGNVLGSNLFNLLMVAGCSAIVCPQIMDKELLRRDWPASILAILLLGGLVIGDMQISRSDGLVLCFFFVLVVGLQVISALRSKRTQSEIEILSPKEAQSRKPLRIAIHLAAGLALVVLGSQFTVNGATELAYLLGLSETVVGLTVVAFGTSLPEFVTSLAAARKGENDIAMGNVIGSNLFNILLILGVSSTITPIAIQPTGIQDMAVLLVVSVALFIPALMGKFGRVVGGLSVATYLGYLGWILLR